MRSLHRPWLAVPVFVVLIALSQPHANEAAGPDSPKVILHNPADVLSVHMALEAAHHKLGKPGCQQVLDDFKDAEGLSLHADLDALGFGPAEYLTLIVYRDGNDLRSGRCRSAGAAAVTHRGDRVVYLCPDNFRAQSPGTRANTLIHEMLHSLGLGENPPSSGAINGQVQKRCGT